MGVGVGRADKATQPKPAVEPSVVLLQRRLRTRPRSRPRCR